MKKALFNLVVGIGFSVAMISIGKAQCVNSQYADLSSKYLINVDFTLINAALSNGSHEFTAWGDGHFTFRKSTTQCIFASDTVYLFYSDRLIPTKSGSQPFSIKKMDKSTFTFDLNANTITQKSYTWKFTSTYTNCVRHGNIVYGFSGNNMIIINLYQLGL